MHMGGFSRPLVRNWIRGRTCALKNRTPLGALYGPETPISAVLPQGGVPLEHGL